MSRKQLNRIIQELRNRETDLPDNLSLHDILCYKAVALLGRIQLRLLSRVQEPVWRSRDGRVHRIRDMRYSHINNAIAMLERQRRVSDLDEHSALMLKNLYAARGNNIITACQDRN